MEKQNLKRAVCIALDFSTPEQALSFLDENFQDQSLLVKIGMELVYASYLVCEVDIIREIRDRGHEIFLDLKLCDIPNTVKKAMEAISCLDVTMVNVHVSGGIKMMQDALAGLGAEGDRPLLLAVTVLTSIDQQCLNDELLVNHTVEDTVLVYAENALEAGLDGVICSPREVASIREKLGDNFLIVTPGIRFPEGDPNDQKRVASPAFAKSVGANVIVMGRSITQAKDPRDAYMRAVAEFCCD